MVTIYTVCCSINSKNLNILRIYTGNELLFCYRYPTLLHHQYLQIPLDIPDFLDCYRLQKILLMDLLQL